MGSAALKVRPETVRLYHLTFYKCGSQWIRDVLSDPRIEECSRHKLAVSGIDLQSSRWPEIEQGQIASPLYTAGAAKWDEISTKADRAFVVVRDPRDIVVSLVYSVAFSHTPSMTTLFLRDPLTNASTHDRMRMGMFMLASWAESMRSWRSATDFPNVFLTRYGRLVNNLQDEMQRLFDFLQWRVPAQVIRTVVDEHSFEARSGRARGTENLFNHLRKGITGDWRNHFDRSTGKLFENAFPARSPSLAMRSPTAGGWICRSPSWSRRRRPRRNVCNC